MAKTFDRPSEDLGQFKSGHAIVAYVFEHFGEKELLKHLESLNISRETAETYAIENRKRSMTKLAELMDKHAAETAYSWDNPANMPADANDDFEHWRNSALRRHMMNIYAGQPDAYQAWLKSRRLAHA
jgi:hypothetical protein